MRKYLKTFLIIFIFPFFLMGCNKNFIETMKSPLRISKPSLNFYTENLIRTVKNSNDVQISIFYSKTGKNKVIPPEYIPKFNLFIDSIKPNYFINPNTTNTNLKDPEYRLTIFINDKPNFIINIFNNQFVTVHPWDGSYECDIIDISYLPDGINIFNTVDFLIKNNVEK